MAEGGDRGCEMMMSEFGFSLRMVKVEFVDGGGEWRETASYGSAFESEDNSGMVAKVLFGLSL